MDSIEYKDFIGSVRYSSEDEVFHGKIEGVNDLITFEGKSVDELKKAFKSAVNDYLDLCKTLNRNPYKSFKGSFNVRVKPEVHTAAFLKATKEGISLNQFVQDAILERLNDN